MDRTHPDSAHCVEQGSSSQEPPRAKRVHPTKGKRARLARGCSWEGESPVFYNSGYCLDKYKTLPLGRPLRLGAYDAISNSHFVSTAGVDCGVVLFLSLTPFAIASHDTAAIKTQR